MEDGLNKLTLPGPVPSGSATGNPQNKVALKKGRGLMDWVRLSNSDGDLAGTGGNVMKVSREELVKHNKRHDAWMALRGKVYNVTPYFEYHPGGEEELLRGVGTDATDLFNEVHKWVNFESMLKKCFIGYYVETKSFFLKPKFLPLSGNKENSLTPPSFENAVGGKSPQTSGKNRVLSPLSPVKLPSPKYDWFQTKTLINITIYTKWKELTRRHVIVSSDCKRFKVYVYIQEDIFIVHLDFLHPVEKEYELRLEKGKIDILMKKALPRIHWSSIGKIMPDNKKSYSVKNFDVTYYRFSIIEKMKVTHDTFLYILDAPSNMHYNVPIGFHVFLRIPGTDIVKPYTPIYFPFQIPTEEGMDKYLKLFVKIYDGGALTPLIANLSVGDSVDVSIPQGSFFQSDVQLAIADSTYLILIGAGTGITPLLKLLLQALTNGIATKLILFNKTEEDIPWKTEFDELMDSHSSHFKVFHVLSSPSEKWDGLKGRVNKDLLDEIIPISDKENSNYICVCGPNVFTDLTVQYLEDIGCLREEIHAFKG